MATSSEGESGVADTKPRVATRGAAAHAGACAAAAAKQYCARVRNATRLALTIACLGSAIGIVPLGVHLAARAGEPALALSVDAAVTATFFALLTFGLASRSRTPLAARLGLGPGRLPSAAIALLAVGLLATSQALDALIQLAGGVTDDGTLAQIEAALAGARGGALLAALAALGIAAAVGEELFFRGLLQRGLTRRIGAVAAIAISATAFGLAHLDLVQGSAALVLGVYLGAVAHLSGGVRAPIACHALNNGIAVLSSAVWPELVTPAPLFAPLGLLVGLGALAVVHRRSARGGPAPAPPASALP